MSASINNKNIVKLPLERAINFPVFEWLEKNCGGFYVCTTKGIEFDDPEDALMFKLHMSK